MGNSPLDRKKAAGAVASSSAEVSAFLQQLAQAPTPSSAGQRGRLVFAMDATASRQATWREAQQVQSAMFQAVSGLGGLDMQLVFFRGVGECRASGWVSQASEVVRLMRQVECVGGHTQIERVLRHTVAEAREKKIGALVYVGDCLEESEDDIAARAGELALLGVPAFVFQEGADPRAQACFREIARITRGAYAAFDANAAAILAELLRAVAVYAAGGLRALSSYAAGAGQETRQLVRQLSLPKS